MVKKSPRPLVDFRVTQEYYTSEFLTQFLIRNRAIMFRIILVSFTTIRGHLGTTNLIFTILTLTLLPLEVFLLKMGSGETIRQSYECSPLLGIVLCVKNAKPC